MIFGRVATRAERLLIVANGPSMRRLNLAPLGELRGVGIVAVNATLPYLPDAHYWFTLDPTPKLRRMALVHRPRVRYFMAVPSDYGQPDAKVHYHRVAPYKAVTYLRRAEGEGLAEEPGRIHSGNSAFGALGLAYHMRPRRVAFLGLDGTAVGYGFGYGSPGPLDHLPALFSTAIAQLAAAGIEVINGNPASLVTCFPRVSTREALQWIAD